MKAVIFDMDGLMFDTENVFMQGCEVVGERMGIKNLREVAMLTLGANKEASDRIFQRELGEQFELEQFRSYIKEYLHDFFTNNHVPVKKGLYILLEYLKKEGYHMAVASSTQQSEVMRRLEDAKIRDYFDAVIGGDMIQKSKPEPDIYLTACKAISQKPEDCYALEDSRNGLLAAFRAGCKAIMVPDLWQPDQEILEIITTKCDDLEKVKEYIEFMK